MYFFHISHHIIKRKKKSKLFFRLCYTIIWKNIVKLFTFHIVRLIDLLSKKALQFNYTKWAIDVCFHQLTTFKLIENLYIQVTISLVNLIYIMWT